MITVIIEGTRNIHNTLTSLRANARDDFRVFVEDSVREEMSRAHDLDFVKPGRLNRYGPKSDLYWVLPSGCLVLTASWDVRMSLCVKDDKKYCLHPAGIMKHFATNLQRNVGKWKGTQYGVPILRVTEV